MSICPNHPHFSGSLDKSGNCPMCVLEASGKRKIVLLKSGGDWNDASVVPLSIPAELNLEEALKEYRVFISSLPAIGPLRKAYLTFEQWLKKNKDAEESPMEEFWDE